MAASGSEKGGRAELLAFTEIPGLPELFLDFLYAFERVAEFYGAGHPLSADGEALRARARQVAARCPDRSALCRLLREQNARWGRAPATDAAIERLAHPETVAVVTGQQPGLFTGPLLTLYKAWAAIRVCEHLRAYGLSAVPIFWIHSEDHDVDEVAGCGLLGRDGEWVEVRYPLLPEEEGRPIGQLVLDGRIAESREALLRALPDSEFLPWIAAALGDAYAEGASWADGFARLLLSLAPDAGLIVLDPSDVRLKRMSRGVFERALRQWPELVRLFQQQSRRVQECGYAPQIHPVRGSSFLFRMMEGRRRPLFWEDGRFGVRRGGETFRLEDLLRDVEEDPTRFSPNVALRPLMQDALLPTLIYVGGPSEIAYFAQLGPLYAAFELTEPLLWPRASLTLVEKRAAELLRRYGLRLPDLFAGVEAIHRRIVEREDSDVSFERVHQAVSDALSALRPSLRETDPTLEGALQRVEERVRQQIEGLRQRYLQARARRDATRARHLRRLLLSLAPHGMPQERAMNIFYFLARYGELVVRAARQEIEPLSAAHRLLFL